VHSAYIFHFAVRSDVTELSYGITDVSRNMTSRYRQLGRGLLTTAAACLLIAAGGCRAIDLYTPSLHAPVPPELEPPRELSKVSLPTYRIEPPDLLSIEVIKLVPRAPYRIDTYDVLQICVLGTMSGEPISGYFLVEGDGIVTLGPAYGAVRVAGMTIEEAAQEITSYLAKLLQQPVATVQLIRSAGAQQVTSQYIVQPDGAVNLGRYGMVRVAGMTIAETRLAVERQLELYFESPQVTVDVLGYYSMTYYVIVAGAGAGENVQRFPITGNDTVLDAICRLEGLPRISSKIMWVARAAPSGLGAEQVLPVDWVAIARGGVTDTNYQLLPGDRLFVVDDSVVATDNYMAKFTRPMARLLNIAGLGASTVTDAQTLGRDYNRHR
jgi:polysaccharide biosynthesis/export protein